jgi:hypothetical protein
VRGGAKKKKPRHADGRHAKHAAAHAARLGGAARE